MEPSRPKSVFSIQSFLDSRSDKLAGAVVAALLIFGGGYWVGQSNAPQAKLPTSKQAISPGAALPLPRIGEVTKRTGDKIAIKQAGGKVVEHTINSATPVTDKGTKRSIDSIKVGNRVVIFVEDKDSTTATRINVVK